MISSKNLLAILKDFKTRVNGLITANNSTLQTGLDDKISEALILTNYTDKITKTENVASLFTTSLNKSGRTITFVINATTNALSTHDAYIGDLPEDCRPISDVCINTVSNKGKMCYVYVDATGKFGFRKTTETSWESGDGVRLTFSFISSK